MQQERRHAQEDRGHDRAEDAVLLDLVRQEAVRDLVAATVGAESAVRVEQTVDAVDHVELARAGRELERDVVEGAVEIEGRAQRVAVHPEHAEALVVGKQVRALDLVDVLGRDPDPDDAQRLPAPVQHGAQPIADFELVGVGEGLAGDHLVRAARLDPATATQMHVVQDRRAQCRDRHEPAGRGLGQSRNVERHLRDDARLDGRDARDRRQRRSQRLRRALERGEDVGEAILGVVRGLRLEQRLVADPERHDRGDAAGDDQRDRDGLAAQMPEVAQQLAVEGPHQASSAGASRRSLR